MRRGVLAAAVVAMLAAGPAAAVEQPQPTPQQAPEGGGKMQFPLDLEDPQDLVGLGILIASGIGAALAGANIFKQLRGERPQASGRWRPR